MTASFISSGEVVKYAWIEWNGEGYTVNIETWEEGRKPLNTLVKAGSLENARALLRGFRNLGYLCPENLPVF